MSRGCCRHRPCRWPSRPRLRPHMAAARQRARESRPAARRAEPLRALRRRAWLAAALCAALGPALAPGPACAGDATGVRAARDATALVAFLPAPGADEAASELA